MPTDLNAAVAEARAQLVAYRRESARLQARVRALIAALAERQRHGE